MDDEGIEQAQRDYDFRKASALLYATARRYALAYEADFDGMAREHGMFLFVATRDWMEAHQLAHESAEYLGDYLERRVRDDDEPGAPD